MLTGNHKLKLTLIHPCVGRLPGGKYIRAWQMESLPIARLAALTPDHFEISFFDDRVEPVQYDHPTDLVALTVETYTARRAYEIASVYRKKNIPVVMGGYHATLCPEEAAEYADAIVTGQAENSWKQLLDDFSNGQMKQFYHEDKCLPYIDVIPDRSIYKNKNYLKIILLEAGRGCRYKCEFCSIQKFYGGQHHYRDIEIVIEEIRQLKPLNRLFFFVDDNIIASHGRAKELFRAMIPLKIRWVSQADITMADDDELLELMVRSGCQGILTGFESLNPENLVSMNKKFNQVNGGMEQAIRKIHKYGIRIYATFLFGYEHDRVSDYREILGFCIRNRFFMVGFNHLTPFPGTELYERLVKENRLLYEKWWLDENYTYGQIPYRSVIPPEIISEHCRSTRLKFYGISSIVRRMFNLTNINSFFMLGFYIAINLLMRKDTAQRKVLTLGDRSASYELLKRR